MHSFPVATGQRAVSPGTGQSPIWSPDGQSIHYVEGSRFMAVDLSTDPSFVASAPRELFQETYLTTGGAGCHRNYDVHPNGDLFLVVASASGGGNDEDAGLLSDVYLVVNWFSRS